LIFFPPSIPPHSADPVVFALCESIIPKLGGAFLPCRNLYFFTKFTHYIFTAVLTNCIEKYPSHELNDYGTGLWWVFFYIKDFSVASG
jgi:hypothetical protein